ncbi:MAG: hypothetical protein ACI4MB_05085 [Candidatus Coproplasma sp.]
MAKSKKYAFIYKGLSVLINLVYMGILIAILYLLENKYTMNLRFVLYGSFGILALILSMFVPHISTCDFESQKFLWALPILLLLASIGLCVVPYFLEWPQGTSKWLYAIFDGLMLTYGIAYSFFFHYKKICVDSDSKEREKCRFIFSIIILPVSLVIGYFISFGLNSLDWVSATWICFVLSLGGPLILTFVTHFIIDFFLDRTDAIARLKKKVKKMAKRNLNGIKSVFKPAKRKGKVAEGSFEAYGVKGKYQVYAYNTGWVDFDVYWPLPYSFSALDKANAQLDLERQLREQYKKEYSINKINFVSNMY